MPIWVYNLSTSLNLRVALFWASQILEKTVNPGLGTAFFCVQNVPFFCVLKRERYVLFRSFFEFFATYETQKNVTFFSVLFKRTEKNAKNVTFFLKERKRTQRT